MNKLLIATTNGGKLAEFKDFLKDIPLTLVSLKDLRITQTVAETGTTFAENAILKARHYGALTNLPTLADDGGFEVDALNGEPGVKSHRWIHQDREDTDEELVAYAIKRLSGIPISQRGAQLRLVLAFVLPSGEVSTVEERVRGIVAEKPSPTITAGFPYRALLFLPEINKFYDQHYLTPEENERYNHRKRAVEKLKPVIREKLV
jgi:XTP/dITP diphosphohydrolase